MEHSPGKNTGVGCPALLQGIFPTQGSNPASHIAGKFFTDCATREAQDEHLANVSCYYYCCYHYYCCYWEKLKVRKEHGEREDKDESMYTGFGFAYEYHTYQGVFLDSTEHSDSKTAMGHLWCCSTQDNIRWELWFPCSTVLAAGQLRCKETRSVVGSCRSSHGSTTHASHEPVSLIATRLAQLSGFWQWTHQIQESPPSGEIKEHYPYQLFIVHW